MLAIEEVIAVLIWVKDSERVRMWQQRVNCMNSYQRLKFTLLGKR